MQRFECEIFKFLFSNFMRDCEIFSEIRVSVELYSFLQLFFKNVLTNFCNGDIMIMSF